MTLHVYSVKPTQLNHFLQGGILGGRVVGRTFYRIHGKTLIFTNPIGTVTFAAPGGSQEVPLTIQDIKAQIELAIVTLRVTYVEGYLGINRAIPSVGVVLSAAGTANTILGFSDSAVTTGKFFNQPGGGVPEFVTLSNTDQALFQIITWE